MKKAENLRFLQIKIPIRNYAKQSDVEASDHIQSMKQNVEIMNQIVKNFYAIQGKSKADRRVQNYVAMELIVEKELIKFFLGVPKDYVETIEKNISSFFAGSVIDYVEQPKLLEAGKFYG
ncbi:MAG: hypothetical protein WCJ81_03710 [bacterium]